MTPDVEPPPARPLTGGAVMSAASRITVALTGAAATILVARLLGPEGAGGYAIAQTLILLLTVATTLGVEHGITYYVSSGRWAAAPAYRSAQRVAVASGLVGALLGLGARLLVPSAFGGLSVGTTVVGVAALPFALSWLYATYLALATDRYEAYALPPAIQSVAALCLVGVLAAVFGVPGAVAGFALAHAVTALVVAATTGRRLTAPDARHGTTVEQRPLRRAIAFGVKGYLANALQFLNYRLDVFVLAGVAGTAAVGQYSVAIAATSVMWLLPQALSEVLFPRVAALRARADAEGDATRAFVEAKSLRHTVLVVVASALVLAAALALLVVPIYGAEFRPAIELGLILLPGVALIGIAGTLSATIVGHGRPGYSLVIAVITTPITIALYAILIPALDATGAALASSVSYALSFLLAAGFYRRVTGAAILPRLIPTRSELDDYRSLAPAIAAWARGVRARRAIG
jgi:O-antigen/teichoic acid export membrane protein